MARVGLDAEAVVMAAAKLIDQHGPESLTLTALAQHLGVKPPSLYAHVQGIDDLRRRLAVLAADELADALAPAAAGLSRGEALLAMGLAYRAWVLAHPGLYQMIDSFRPGEGPTATRVLDLVLAVLRGYGLDGEPAIHAARTLRSAIHGFAGLEAHGGFGMPVDLEASFQWMLATIDRGLSVTSPPSSA